MAGEPAASDGETAHWVVAGRVQGVGFRWFVREAAERHAVRGDVRNLPDGRVEIRAAGTARALRRLLVEVQHGPAGARVDAVETLPPEPVPELTGFRIRR